MARIPPHLAGGENVCAFLDMIANSELGPILLRKSDAGYNVIVGSTPTHPILFASYRDHPRRLIDLPNLGIKSTAAGRYQLLAHYFDDYKRLLKLKDFSPESQDLIAIQQIRESRALDAVKAGEFAGAVALCSHIWASLPGARYGQHTNKLADLKAYYTAAGGTLA
jgi:muramidase (phage lysozyme)